jgi:2-amino-4-hydroxy-6-hydroxymethyldihydropteridine diphosphokinase
VQFITAYIGLGSNLQDPLSQLQQAVNALREQPSTNQLVLSPLYRSAPLGTSDQPDYLNAVVALTTELGPEALLDHLQSIEQHQGRLRTRRWGPRTVDLDILLYGDRVQATPRLTIPHPRLHERAFVLYPLWDVTPTLVVPGLGSLRALLERCPPWPVEKVAEEW